MAKFIANPAMDQLVDKHLPDMVDITRGELINGQVLDVTKNYILVDLGGLFTGIIQGKEIHDTKKTAEKLVIGDTVNAIVLDEENEDGLVVLSLKRASQKNAWNEFQRYYEDGVVFEVKANEANKGGLLTEIDGIKGFLPVSQLAPLHYPRVEGANSEKILSRLQSLVGHRFKVKIINIDFDNKKLILSEKEAEKEETMSALGTLKVGQIVKGKISGIVSYGLFVTFNGLEGLVHISEIAWGHVASPNSYGKIGDEVEVLVIGVDESKISLSMKRLVKDPWIDIAQKYKVGDIVEGPVTRITNFGCFVKIEEDINGLVHLSEIAHEVVKDPNKYLTVGEKVKAEIITLDLDEHRIGLSIKATLPIPPELKAKLEAEKKAAEEAEAEAKEEKKSKKEKVEEEAAE